VSVTYRAAAMLILAGSVLAGCDAWPTNVVDHAGAPIQFRWHHKDYPEWSAWVPVPPGKSVILARAHYVEDFVGMEVDEAGHRYAVSPQEMGEFRRTCSRSLLDHITTLGDCEIVYDGSGRFSVHRVQ
jgi:hypothetical protein